MDEEEILLWTGVVDDIVSNAALGTEGTLFMDELMQRVPDDAVVTKYVALAISANEIITLLVECLRCPRSLRTCFHTYSSPAASSTLHGSCRSLMPSYLTSTLKSLSISRRL